LRRAVGSDEAEDFSLPRPRQQQLPVPLQPRGSELRQLSRIASTLQADPPSGGWSVPASSGKTILHRPNRGGDRHADSALHIIAIVRLRTDPNTKAYVAKRVAEGHSKLEAIRALKRYIVREVFGLITRRQKQINQGPIVA
jgi:hypothetical protein